ncbi:MAG: Hg(II)-responsive transcriptional regulator [Betaproteobacteria bacterium RIFCSPLOWO2_12_FULL_62_58]|nr:MAG: Hg(II)-responsive transcriptional regulator [Betaproteobacteria bacterium RIFCSPLOWO2_12_FULL_62_58]
MLKPATPRTGITIGQLAETAGVNVETIRYYQRIGLLPLPKRDYGSIRRYSADDLKRVRFVKRAQALGFSLDEVALLLGLSDGKHCAETKSLAEKKLAMVEEKIADLTAIQKSLMGLVTQCSIGSRGCGCPIIDALVKDDARSGKRALAPLPWR